MANVAQNAFRSIFVRFVWVAAAFALSVDVFAFSVGQIFEQVFQTAFAPIRQFDAAGHRFDFFNDRLSHELRPVAVISGQLRHGTNVGTSGAIFFSASFFVHFDMETSLFAIAFTAANTKTAHAAFFWNLETGWRWYNIRYVAFEVQTAMIAKTVCDIRKWKPLALTPFVIFAKSGALSGFFSFYASCAFVIRMVRMTTTFATAIFLKAIAFGHHFQKFTIRFTAPIGNVRTESACLEGFGEHTPAAADQGRRRQIANVSEFGTCGFFAFDRQASFFAITFATTKFETALTAFVWHDEIARH